MPDDSSRIDLYELLPAIYRIDDAARGYPLRALMQIVSEQANLLKDDIGGLHDDLFIATCADWVIPYLGELVANQPIHEAVRGRRADVAKTIYYRRRKGTLPMLEELARDVTGWSAHAVAFFEQLDWTQNLNHLRDSVAPNRDGRDPVAFDRVGTAHVRNASAMDLLDGPFDLTAHTVDVRRIRRTRGWHNLRNVGFFLWRLESYRMNWSEARPSSVPHGWHFSPLGNSIPLFTFPDPDDRETSVSSEIHVRGPIRPGAFRDDLAEVRRGGPSLYFGVDGRTDRSIGIQLQEGTTTRSIRPSEVACMDLSDWERPPAAVSGVFSGILGAINLTGTPSISVTIGNEGTHSVSLPTGALTVAAMAEALQSDIAGAASTRGFAGVRVISLGNRLLILPGVRGASLSFAATASDALSLVALKFDAPTSASALLSGDLTDFPSTLIATPRLEVTFGNQPPFIVTLASTPAHVADAASQLETALQIGPSAEFATAQVRVVGSRLLILPGVDGVRVRVRATLDDPSTAELLRLTNQVGVCVRRGRISFALGDEPASGSVKVAYNYGFSADLGGGPYDRREPPRRLGQAERERPDTVRFPEALGKLIRVDGTTTLSAALALWNPATDPRTVIQIQDHRIFAETVTVNLSGGELILQAAEQIRPTLLGNLIVNATGGTGRFRLDGLWVAGELRVNGDLAELRIAHTTLVPVAPDAPSLVIADTNVRLRTFIDRSICGSLVVPREVVSLEIRDSIIDSSRPDGRASRLGVLISGAANPFPVPTSANPTLRITIGDEGPLTIALGAVPADRAQAAGLLEAAIRTASPAKPFSDARVLSADNRFYVVGGDCGLVSFQTAPGDDTAAKWLLLSSHSQTVFGLMSGALSEPLALSDPAPTLDTVVGNGTPKTIALAGSPTTLDAARTAIETAIQNADVATEFTGARVFRVVDRLLVVPGIPAVPAIDPPAISFVHRPCDPTTLLELKLESARPSIAGSVGGERPTTASILEHVTILGGSYFRELTLVSGVLFDRAARAERRQAGCVRFSYLASGSRTPRRYRCQPDLALEGVPDLLVRETIRNRLRPEFTSVQYGDPGYAQLGLECAAEIKTGAENGAEIGAFNSLMQPQREANLKFRLEEYLPFGLEPGLIYIT